MPNYDALQIYFIFQELRGRDHFQKNYSCTINAFLLYTCTCMGLHISCIRNMVNVITINARHCCSSKFNEKMPNYNALEIIFQESGIIIIVYLMLWVMQLHAPLILCIHSLNNNAQYTGHLHGNLAMKKARLRRPGDATNYTVIVQMHDCMCKNNDIIELTIQLYT